MTLITGDTHGDFKRIAKLCKQIDTSYNDTIIVLGDAGINYFCDIRDKITKENIKRLYIKLFCIHGNHEQRAELISTYITIDFWGGKALVEERYPNIIFAIDGEIYNIPTQHGDKQAIVIGGAYSVDKAYRIANGAKWFDSEQPSTEIKNKVEGVLKSRNNKIDIVLSHTCPQRHIPCEWFIGGIDQSSVDNSTEIWLDEVFERLEQFDKWYCGHYHGSKRIDKLEFMFTDIKEM